MGESTAKFLARARCGVAVADVLQERADRVANVVADLGQPSAAIVGDVLDDAEVPEIVARAEREFGGLDVLVTVVGQASFNSVLDMTPEQWDLDQRRNLRCFFFTAREVARSLVARGKPGAIVGISSVKGLQSAPNNASYGAAKAGMINLVRTMAVELAPHDIRVNVIALGTITTPRIPDTSERLERVRHGHIPFERRGTADEIGKVALFLVSDLASYVTGQLWPWTAAGWPPPSPAFPISLPEAS